MQFHTIRWYRALQQIVASPRARAAFIGFTLAAASVAGSAALRWK